MRSLTLFAVFLFALSLFGFMGDQYWVAEAIAAFRIQYLFAFGVLLLISLVFRRKLIILLSLAGILLNAAILLPVYQPMESANASPEQKQERPVYTLLQSNLHYINQDHQSFLNYLHQIQPDILTVEEMSYGWRKSLVADEWVAKNFPYYFYTPEKQLAIFSRFPLKQTKIYQTSAHPLADEFISAKVQIPNQPALTVLVIHPKHPTSARDAQMQQETFNALIENKPHWEAPYLMVGDFNTVPWSAGFRRLQTALNLNDSRQGFGLHPTWSPLEVGVPLLPIDHVLTSGGIHVHSREVGRNVGSDHRPVIMEFRLAKP